MDNTIAYIRADSAQQIGQVGYFRPNALFGLEEQLDYYFNEDASVILGVVGEAEKLAADFSQTFSGDPHVRPPRPPAPDFEKNTLASFYAQTHYRFCPSLELSAGARLDRSSYYGTVLTPRLGLVYNRNAYTAKILYLEAFRAPKPWDYNWGDGNPNLKPEQMRSFELAGICTPNKYLRMEVNLYSNLVFEKLTQTANQWINAERLKTNGLEANLDYSRNRTQWNANYTLTDSKYADGSCVPEIARHSFNAGVSYSFSPQLSCNLRGNYLGARRNPVYITASHSFNVDAYFILNGTINYHPLTSLDMQLCVNNILNAVYYHTSNRPPERYRQPQRSVLVSLSYQL